MVIDLYSYIEDVDDDGLDDDVPMKPLPRVEFEHFQDKLGVVRKDLPRKGGVVMLQRDCIILVHLSIIDPVTSVIENVMGLYHPWAPSLK